jgi:peptidoglycan hydrolase-like protein with peptidoglycan-binding domain
MTKNLSLAALCLLLCAGPALAQDGMPKTWDSVDGSFNFQGQDVAITVERSTRKAFLFEYREGPESGDPMSTVRSAPRTLSPALMKQVEKAVRGAKPAKWTSLKRGDQGKLVKLLQKKLNSKGAQLTVDGDFGPATQRALRAYQRSQDLFVTGTLDVETRDLLGFHPPTGHLTVNAQHRALETNDKTLAGTLRLIVATVQRGQEPVRKTIDGTILEFDHGLRLYEDRDENDKGAAYDVSGWHPALDHAASLLGGVQAEAYVFETSGDSIPEAILIDLKVKATERSLPKGVKVGETVKVTGLRKIPTRKINTPKGPRIVGGTVVAVETKDGKKGVLESPQWSGHLPRVKKTGIAAVISNKNKGSKKLAPR